MTREDINKRIIQACKNMWNEKVCKEIEDALEPCEDAISRKQAIKTIAKYCSPECVHVCVLKELPPVVPKGVTVTDFADKCRECGKQKKGEWCKQNDDYFDWYECSECGYGSEGEMQYSSEYDVRTKYCPNCGSFMMEEIKKSCNNCTHHTDADEIHGITPCGSCGVEKKNFEQKTETESEE